MEIPATINPTLRLRLRIAVRLAKQADTFHRSEGPLRMNAILSLDAILALPTAPAALEGISLPASFTAGLFAFSCLLTVAFLAANFGTSKRQAFMATGVSLVITGMAWFAASQNEQDREKRIASAQIEHAAAVAETVDRHCPSVLEAVRDGSVKELMREDVLKIRWACGTMPFLDAVNSETAVLDITFSSHAGKGLPS